ncbi:MAG: serine hydrolase [Oscillospiraceae bacterium]|nr:serine hydrolase [Oscillospiraceae bacterium]
MNREKIAAALENAQKSTTAGFGAAFMDLESGYTASVNGDKPFPLASVFKVYVLAEFFRLVEAGELSLDERIELTADMIVAGSGILKNMRPGMSLTMYDYAYLMMAYSDNTATDLVTRAVGLERVRKNILEAFDLAKTQVDYTCRELLAITYDKFEPDGEVDKHTGKLTYRNGDYFRCTADKNDQSTPNDLMRFFKLMYDGVLPNAAAAKQALEMMKKCGTNSRIPARLPLSVEVAHKTGSLGRLANDAGIVYTAKGNYILVLSYNGNVADYDEYCDNFRNSFGADILSKLSREVYDAYVEE